MEKPSVYRQFIETVFYGNFFYGICVALSAVETDMLQSRQPNPWWFYLTLGMATVLFYNYPYARLDLSGSQHPRTAWHQRYLKPMQSLQVVLTLSLLCIGSWMIAAQYEAILGISWQNALLLAIFPALGGLYYGLNIVSLRYNLRSVGWLKPFIIGFVWAGVTVIYPELYPDILAGSTFEITHLTFILFLKNTMYLSVLAIMFDIKDYTADSKADLRTLVVSIGLRKTIFYVLLPLPFLGLLVMASYGIWRELSALRMLLLAVPIILLIPAAYSLRRRRSLLYYLVVIDGLILLKALFGIGASYF